MGSRLERETMIVIESGYIDIRNQAKDHGALRAMVIATGGTIIVIEISVYMKYTKHYTYISGTFSIHPLIIFV